MSFYYYEIEVVNGGVTFIFFYGNEYMYISKKTFYIVRTNFRSNINCLFKHLTTSFYKATYKGTILL